MKKSYRLLHHIIIGLEQFAPGIVRAALPTLCESANKAVGFFGPSGPKDISRWRQAKFLTFISKLPECFRAGVTGIVFDVFGNICWRGAALAQTTKNNQPYSHPIRQHLFGQQCRHSPCDQDEYDGKINKRDDVGKQRAVADESAPAFSLNVKGIPKKRTISG